MPAAPVFATTVATRLARTVHRYAVATAVAFPGAAAAVEISEVRVGVVSNDVVLTGKSGLSFPDPFRHRTSAAQT